MNESGAPVVDAWIRIQGLQSIWLSSGDGFFTVLNLAPGKHAIAVTKEGFDQKVIRGIDVTAGEAVTLKVQLAKGE